MNKTASVANQFAKILKIAQPFEDEPPGEADLYVKVGGSSVGGGEQAYQLRMGPSGYQVLRDGQVMNEHEGHDSAAIELLDMVAEVVQGSGAPTGEPMSEPMTEMANVANKFIKVLTA